MKPNNNKNEKNFLKTIPQRNQQKKKKNIKQFEANF